jgi:hypothetical protein
MSKSLAYKLLIDYFLFLRKNYFFTLLCFYFLYLLFLIYRTSFVIDGTIYFSLFDDEMVSMRYAKNLVLGNGLVWNIGERIEGFSNPLWTFYMAFWHLFGLADRLVSLPIQLTNVFLLLANLYFVKKIAELVSNKNELTVFLAVLFTAFYFSINNWAILGTETTPLMLITTYSVYSFLKQKFGILNFILLAIGILIRLDFSIIYLVFLGMLFFHKKINLMLSGALIFIGIIITQFGLRNLYYGEFLPNTYFLKMTGFSVYLRIIRGAYYFIEFILKSGIVFILPFLFILKSKKIFLFFPLITFQVLYSIYAGGDVWEYFGGANRYLAIVMPLYFIILALVFKKLSNLTKKSLVLNLLIFLLIPINLFILNSAGKDMMRDFLGLTPHQIVGANKLNTQKALVINKIADENSTVALEWAGVTPYFSNEMYHIDILGKNDKYIARLESKEFIKISEKPFWDLFLPGHTKWDYNYSIIKKRPDIISQMPSNFKNLKFISDNYIEVKVGDDKIYYKSN